MGRRDTSTTVRAGAGATKEVIQVRQVERRLRDVRQRAVRLGEKRLDDLDDAFGLDRGVSGYQPVAVLGVDG